MKGRRLGFKPSLRDQQRTNKLNMELYRTGPEQHPDIVKLFADVKPKQTRAKPGADGRKLESEVQLEIIKYLLQHPAVAMVERINSGAVYGESGNFIRFHHLMLPKKWIGRFGRLRVVDLNVMMDDGRRLAIECKREGWLKPTDDREKEQANYLAFVKFCGGIGIFATSTEAVSEALRAAFYSE